MGHGDSHRPVGAVHNHLCRIWRRSHHRQLRQGIILLIFRVRSEMHMGASSSEGQLSHDVAAAAQPLLQAQANLNFHEQRLRLRPSFLPLHRRWAHFCCCKRMGWPYAASHTASASPSTVPQRRRCTITWPARPSSLALSLPFSCCFRYLFRVLAPPLCQRHRPFLSHRDEMVRVADGHLTDVCAGPRQVAIAGINFVSGFVLVVGPLTAPERLVPGPRHFELHQANCSEIIMRHIHHQLHSQHRVVPRWDPSPWRPSPRRRRRRRCWCTSAAWCRPSTWVRHQISELTRTS